MPKNTDKASAETTTKQDEISFFRDVPLPESAKWRQENLPAIRADYQKSLGLSDEEFQVHLRIKERSRPKLFT